MKTDMTESYAATQYMKNYVKEHNIEGVWDLFSKETLVEFVNQADWDWSIEDEINENNCTEEEARSKTEEWFMSMDKVELWERINSFSQTDLLLDKAYDLGFEW